MARHGLAGRGGARLGMEGERGPEWITPAFIENDAKREKLTIRGTAGHGLAGPGAAWRG